MQHPLLGGKIRGANFAHPAATINQISLPQTKAVTMEFQSAAMHRVGHTQNLSSSRWCCFEPSPQKAVERAASQTMSSQLARVPEAHRSCIACSSALPALKQHRAKPPENTGKSEKIMDGSEAKKLFGKLELLHKLTQFWKQRVINASKRQPRLCQDLPNPLLVHFPAKGAHTSKCGFLPQVYETLTSQVSLFGYTSFP